MRVAVVGAGVSGLVAAYLLNPEHDVTVFEGRDRIGGHVNTVHHQDEQGRWAIDTGFIVYNEHNYPLFTRLLKRLDVTTQPTDMGFSVRCDDTGLEYNGSTIRQLFVQKKNLLDPSYYGMIRDILRFNREAPLDIRGDMTGVSLGEYIAARRYSPRLADHYLVPMGSALWSLPRSQILDMPAEFFLRFFENHGMLTVNDRPQWRVIQGGSERYVASLTRDLGSRIRTSTPVASVRREEDVVLVNGEPFDQVVLACHSDQALEVLDDPTPDEREVLGAMPYQMNEVVLHTDRSFLPKRRRAWGAWNYRLSGNEGAPATVTYNMNILQTLSADRTFCVTLNPTSPIPPEAVLYSTRFSHPLYTVAGEEARNRKSAISGVNRTHYCGAYWGYGFHEDGVRSAVDVAATFGAQL